MTDDELVKSNLRERARQRASISKLRAENRLLEQLLDEERKLNAAFVAMEDRRGVVHRLPEPHVAKPKGRKTATTVALASDWHVDECVLASKVAGINSYNPKKADACITEYFERVPKVVAMFGTSYTVARHIQWMGGDLFTGHLHDDNIETVARTPIESLTWLRPRLVAGVEALLDRCKVDEVTVVWNFGNHGRTTHKPRIATASGHNYEWLLGQFLMGEFGIKRSGDVVATGKGRPRLRWIAEAGYHTYVKAAGLTIRFHHGDWAQCGAKATTMVNRLKSMADDWNRGRHADLDVLGHFHTSLDLPWAVTNGSMIGYNAYAQSIKAAPEDRQQGFFLLDHERRCKAAYARIHLPK